MLSGSVAATAVGISSVGSGVTAASVGSGVSTSIVGNAILVAFGVGAGFVGVRVATSSEVGCADASLVAVLVDDAEVELSDQAEKLLSAVVSPSTMSSFG